MKSTFRVLCFLFLFAATAVAQESTANPMLIGQVSANQTHVAFSYAGDIWLVERSGGTARRLTTDPADEDFPRFSPDGSKLAFSRILGGGSDIFVMPAQGGEAKRLTYYPKADVALGWSADSKTILFLSTRDEEATSRLYTIAADGIYPTMLPLPEAVNGSLSPDGNRIAYTPYDFLNTEWRYYRGGMEAHILLAQLTDGSIERLPAGDYNDRYPMWVGDKVYFLSDRTGTANLYVYDLKSKQTKSLTAFEKYGIRSATTAGDAIAFVRDGRIYLFDLKNNQARALNIQASPDTAQLNPRAVNAARQIQSFAPSATGDRIVFGARGEAFIFDPTTGAAKNITRSSGAAEREAVISPDGRWLAYFSDETGEYQLHVRAADGEGAVRKIAIEPKPSFYRELTWSPDSKRLVFSDKHLSLWLADIDKGAARKLDTSLYSLQDRYYPNFSPDGRWLAYAKAHRNRLRTIYLYDTSSGKTQPLTDGSVHTEYPVFDQSGKYLYFTSSANAGLSEFGWGVLSGEVMRPIITRRLHALILRNDLPSPLLANGQPNPDANLSDTNIPTRIDFENLESRIITFPIDARDYAELAAGKPGIVYAATTDWPKTPGNIGDQTLAVYRYDISKPREIKPLVEDITASTFSANGSKLLYRKGGNWHLVSADAAPKPDDGQLDLKALEVTIDPRAEWRQIYREAWRIMRDYFYDANHHGQNIAELEPHYGQYLATTVRRQDLNSLLRMALGHISVSHLGVGGGDVLPQGGGGGGNIGLIGADYRIHEGRYQFARVLRSAHFTASNSLLRAPLDQPGMNVKEGEYLLAVDGQEVTATKSVHAYFENKTGRPTKIAIGAKPNGEGARTITVIPVPGEQGLRRANWAERNRRIVEQLSGGKLAYIYVPDYGPSIMENFLRGVLGYRGEKQGFIIDQRYNGGGITSDFIIELLQRQPLYHYMFRDGEDIATPTNPVPGPKVLIINEQNGSAAETFPFMFKLGKVGTIVGRRTAGGGIGPYVFSPAFIDGGRVQLPNRAAFNSQRGSWDVENHGVEPDVDIEILPKDFLAGRDPQLEKAIEIALKQLPTVKPTVKVRPPYPVHK